MPPALVQRLASPRARRRQSELVKRCAMKWAWPTLTQKPSARMRDGSAIFRRISSTTRCAHAWSAVRTFESGDVVSLPAAPRDVAQVEPVVNAEVRERREVLLVDGVPQPQLGGDPAVEVTRARRGRRLARASPSGRAARSARVVEQRLVRRRRCVVELVHDHDVEVGRVDSSNSALLQALDRREDVLEPLGPLATDPLLAEGCVA